MISVTLALHYRSGAEVLLHEAGLPSMPAAAGALRDIADWLEQYGDMVTLDGAAMAEVRVAEVVVRAADHRFAARLPGGVTPALRPAVEDDEP